VMVLLLWLYVSSLAILVGAEMNAEIEHASPHGKEPGEKVPGQRKRIGVLAARAWQARHSSARSQADAGSDGVQSKAQFDDEGHPGIASKGTDHAS